MSETPKKPSGATYDDLLRVPDHKVAEILEGELVVSPRPASRHARVAGVLHWDLVSFERPPGGGAGEWWLLFEPELHLGPDVVVPDLAGWRRERMPVIPDTPAFTLAPDWVCEVISPSTARHDRVQKRRIYARARVSWLWFVDPIARTLEVHRLEGDGWLLVGTHAGGDRVRVPPFEALELDLSAWWLD